MTSSKEEQARTIDVEVVVDGTPLEMVPFVRRMVAGTILGMIGQLRGGENAREIRIRLRREG